MMVMTGSHLDHSRRSQPQDACTHENQDALRPVRFPTHDQSQHSKANGDQREDQFSALSEQEAYA